MVGYSAVEKLWKDIGGNQEDMISAEKFGGCEAKVEKRIGRR